MHVLEAKRQFLIQSSPTVVVMMEAFQVARSSYYLTPPLAASLTASSPTTTVAGWRQEEVQNYRTVYYGQTPLNRSSARHPPATALSKAAIRASEIFQSTPCSQASKPSHFWTRPHASTQATQIPHSTTSVSPHLKEPSAMIWVR